MKSRIISGAIVSCILELLSNSVLYAQLANSPWPMFHANAQHVGQSEYGGYS